jgi:hypothetical protein
MTDQERTAVRKVERERPERPSLMGIAELLDGHAVEHTPREERP